MSYAKSYRSSKPVQIYYEDIGDKSLPILVMQHGDGNDSQNWKSLGYVERLIPHFRLILIDYLGYGQSEKSYDPKDYSFPLLASDTIAVLKYLNITKPVTFFGGSMGGRVGYELAITPEFATYFDKFIISCASASQLDFVLEIAKWVDIGGMSYVVEQFENTFIVEAFPAEIRATFLRNDPKAYHAANLNVWPDVCDKLHLIDKPVLLICGEKAGERIDMEKDANIIQHSDIRILPGLDHSLTYWDGHLVAPLIIDFMKR